MQPEPVFTYFGERGNSFNSVCFSPKTEKICSVGSEGKVYLWSLPPQNKLSVFTGHKDMIFHVDIARNGEVFATGSKDKSIRIWTLGQMESENYGNSFALKKHKSDVRGVHFLSDAKTLISGSDDETIRSWDIERKKNFQTFNSTSPLCCLDVSNDDKLLVTGHHDCVRVWDFRIKECIGNLKESMVYSVQFHPDNSCIATGNFYNVIRIFDISVGKSLQTYKERSSINRCVCFHPSGKFLISGSRDEKIGVYDLLKHKELFCLHEHQDSVNCLSFQSNGSHFASGSNDGKVVLWKWKSNLKSEIRLPFLFSEIGSNQVDVGDRGFVLKSVMKDGLFLMYVTKEDLLGDLEIVTSAIENDGRAIRYAKTLKNNDSFLDHLIRNSILFDLDSIDPSLAKKYEKGVDKMVQNLLDQFRSERSPNSFSQSKNISLYFQRRGRILKEFGKIFDSFKQYLIAFEFDDETTIEPIRNIARILLEDKYKEKEDTWLREEFFPKIESGILNEDDMKRFVSSIEKTFIERVAFKKETDLMFDTLLTSIQKQIYREFSSSTHSNSRQRKIREVLKKCKLEYLREKVEKLGLFHVYDNERVYVGLESRIFVRNGYGMDFVMAKNKNKKRKKKSRGKINVVYRRVFAGRNKKGKKHGKGIEFDPNDPSQAIFEGSFVNDVREGKGIEYAILKGSDEGEQIFEGIFKNNKRHGRGEEYDPVSKEVRRGNWVEGKLDTDSVFTFDCPMLPYKDVSKHLRDAKIVGRGGNGVVYSVKSSSIPFMKKKFRTRRSSSPFTGRKTETTEHHINTLATPSIRKRAISATSPEGIHHNKGINKVAVKIMKARRQMQRTLIFRMIRRAIGYCHNVDCENILETYGIIRGPNCVGYVMKLCEKSVCDLIEEGNIDLDEKLRILSGTVKGMCALHSNYLIHRDLKWSNVFLDHQKVVKIGDYDTLREDTLYWRLKSTMIQSSQRFSKNPIQH